LKHTSTLASSKSGASSLQIAPGSRRLQKAHKPIGEFSPHVIGCLGGLTINGGTRYAASLFYADYETFDFVFHSLAAAAINVALLFVLIGVQFDTPIFVNVTRMPESRIVAIQPCAAANA
jgi:hypothetical protein